MLIPVESLHGELQRFAPEKTVRFAAAAGMLAYTIVGDTPMSSEKDILRQWTATVGRCKR